MTDDRHAPGTGPGTPANLADRFQRLVDDLVPEEMRWELGRLAVEGDQILCQLRPWSRHCWDVFERFEALLKPHSLSDEKHGVIGVAVGIDRLYGIMNKLSVLAEPHPPQRAELAALDDPVEE